MLDKHFFTIIKYVLIIVAVSLSTIPKQDLLYAQASSQPASLPTKSNSQPSSNPTQEKIKKPEQLKIDKVETHSEDSFSPTQTHLEQNNPKNVAIFESTIRVKKQTPLRAQSDFRLDKKLLIAAPHQNASELLVSAPGVYVSKPEGEAVANQIFLRGFDAEHGQDIELNLGFIPLNQVSHLHGQGYANLNFIIPETVRSVRVLEGVYDPIQADFATAGSVEFDLGVIERGLHLHSSYGSFNTFKELILWAPKNEREETFFAVNFQSSKGFGQNRASLSGSALGQYVLKINNTTDILLTAAAFGVRAGLAGIVRQDDVESGLVPFYGSYDDPSARAQSAFSSRAHAGAILKRKGINDSLTTMSLWFVFNDFSVRQNFTGYTQRSSINPDWVGLGDLIEQRNRQYQLGTRGSHRFEKITYKDKLEFKYETGFLLKTDLIDQSQNLLKQPQNETWDNQINAQILASAMGVYLDSELQLIRWISLHAGFRADMLHFNINDKLGNRGDIYRSQNYVPGYRRQALGFAYGPRASLSMEPRRWFKVTFAYGEGYRSAQARLLSEGENAPFAKVRSTEIGFQFRPLSDTRLTISAIGYATFLNHDLVFEPAQARLENVGPTSRKGAVIHIRAEPWPFLLSSLSVTYVNATLDSPPISTAENPNPYYQKGELLPYVPPVVIREDLHFHGHLVTLKGHSIEGQIGIGFTYLGKRPLPGQQFAKEIYLLDLSLGAKWRFLELSIEAFNILNLKYSAMEYSFVSYWPNRTIQSLVPAKQISAGPPISIQGTLGLRF